METKKTKHKTPEPLKENEAGGTPEQPTATDDFFAPTDMKADLNDFVKHMKAPREKIEAPPITFGEEEEEAAAGIEDADVIDEVEPGTLSHFDYDEDHEKTAEFGWIMLDEMMSFLAGLYSGEDADKYKRFGEKKQPTSYQIMVGAAMVKKYQAKMSLEWMFVTVVFMAFAPQMSAAHRDRVAAKRKAAMEDEARRIALMRGNIM